MVHQEPSSSITSSSSSSSSSSPLECFSLMSMSMSLSPTPSLYGPARWIRELKSDERGLYLIHLLINCASHVSSGNLDHANSFLETISLLSSPDGDTMQRIASYFTDALARRILRSWPGIYRALLPLSSASASDTFQARRHFLDLCPFLRLSHLLSNQAIIESMEGEKIVHVIDLNSTDPSQCLSLLQSLSSRPEGPPHLRITGVNEHPHLLAHVGSVLSQEAEKLDVPFQFNPVVGRADTIHIETLRVKTGEALAINSLLHLHSLLVADDGHDTSGFLSAMWGLSPKILVMTEQESNHNGATLNERFMEALNFYAALFDCLESTVARNSVERARVEKMLFGEEIKNIIAYEGMERKERHEKLERWVKRLDGAGFGRVPMSYYGLLQARRMLQGFGCDAYKVKEEDGCFLICWQDRPLFSVSAWRCRRFD